MLVLTRKQGEEIVLPDQQVIIHLTEVRGGRVRIGITAPDHVRILRQELWSRESTEGYPAIMAAADQ